MRLKNNFGLYIFLLITLMPGLIWFLMLPITNRFASTTTILTSLGQLAGLTGMALFAVTLILMSRNKWLEKMLAGLNKMYNYHHILGATSFVLLLFHPIFLAIKFWLFSPKTAALFLLPSDDWNINFGIFALLIMIAAIVLTFFGRLLYEHWRLSHKFLGLAFFLGGLHAFLVPTDISRSWFLKIYMLGLALVALAIYIYRSLLQRWLVPKYDYQVIEIVKKGKDIIEITLAPEINKIDFRPGQFVFAEFYQANFKSEIHPFSISSDNRQENIKLAIKNLGDYSAGLKKLKIGAMAKIEGPFGIFSDELAEHKKQIWIGGGIGITPILSMSRSLPVENNFEITIYYCVKNENEAVFSDELKIIAEKNPAIELKVNYSDSQGHLTVEKLKNMTKIDFDKTDVFICGPKPMMISLKNQLIAQKMPTEQIYTEEFTMY